MEQRLASVHAARHPRRDVDGTGPLAARWRPMLEHIPHWLGHSLANVRAGADRLTVAALDLASAPSLALTSPAFADGGRLPDRFTADGDGVSPPLAWAQEPEGTKSLALIVEDPDAPAQDPLVHAILFDIAPGTHALDEGAITADADDPALGETGRNSFLGAGWLAPDPPTGHGEHRYVFQLFALDTPVDLTGHPGRGAIREAIAGHVLAAGVLTATYSREDPAASGPVGSAAAIA